jgi:HPt (histidine-containing phosphotransfer) domain-containing protein
MVSADSAEKFAQLNRAIAQKDAKTLFTAAHALKGGLATLAARRASGAALELESMGRTGTFTGAAARLAALEKESAQALKALRKFASEDGLVTPAAGEHVSSPRKRSRPSRRRKP